MKISFRKVLFIGLFSLLMLGAIFSYQFAKFYDGKLHVVFCNVGQGDGIFIRSPQGLDVVIDGGPDSSILSCLSKHMPFWDRDLELVILTHPHADHLNGLISVLQRYIVLQFASQNLPSSSSSYQELVKLLKEKKVKQISLAKGDKFSSNDGLSLETEFPTKQIAMIKGAKTNEKDEYFGQNEASIIELLRFGDLKILFTGDASWEEEIQVSNSVGDIDILKVSHHGSKSGTNEEFLKTITPELAVISVGKNNRYNLPHPKTIEILKQLGIKLLRTDENGEVEIVSDGKKWLAK